MKKLKKLLFNKRVMKNKNMKGNQTKTSLNQNYKGKNKL